jgi:hypothetical protein
MVIQPCYTYTVCLRMFIYSAKVTLSVGQAWFVKEKILNDVWWDKMIYILVHLFLLLMLSLIWTANKLSCTCFCYISSAFVLYPLNLMVYSDKVLFDKLWDIMEHQDSNFIFRSCSEHQQ